MNRVFHTSVLSPVVERLTSSDWRGWSVMMIAIILLFPLFSFSSPLDRNLEFSGCAGAINATLGTDCTYEVTAAAFLEGDPDCNDYVVEVSEIGGPEPRRSNILDQSDIGKSFKVSITPVGDCDFNACWGILYLEDKLPPSFPEKEPVLLSCSDWDIDTRRLEGIDPLTPEDLQECSELELFQLNTLFIKSEQCLDPDTVYYIYTAKDINGFANSMRYCYLLEKPMAVDIIFPPHFDGIDVHSGNIIDNGVSSEDPLTCDGAGVIWNPLVLPDGTIVPSPYDDGELIGVGTPEIEGCSNILATFEDKIVPICDQDCQNNNLAKKILRTWTIIEWCTESTLTHQIFLLIEDNEAPIISSPSELEVSTDPWKCTAEFEINIEATDNCTEDEGISYILTGPAGVSITGGDDGEFNVKHVGVGEALFTAYAEDCCGNVSAPFPIVVQVIDSIRPTAIAKEFSVISLIPEDPVNFDETGIAKFYADNLDNGSWDACSDVRFLVRRADGDPNNCDDKDCYPTAEEIEDIMNEVNPPLSEAEAEMIAVQRYRDVVECLTEDGFGPFIGERISIHNGLNLECNSCAEPGTPDFNREIRNAEIEFNGDAWGDFVSFCCEDAVSNASDEDIDGDGFKNDHKVELFVIDRAGNWSLTWGWVKVEDPTPPRLIIEPVDLFCHDQFNFQEEEIALARFASSEEFIIAESGCKDNIRFSKIEGPFYMKGGPQSLNPDPALGEDPHPDLFGSQIDFPFKEGNWQAFNRTCKYGFGWLRYTAETIKGAKVIGYQLIKVIYKDDFTCEKIDFPELDFIITDCEIIPVEEDLLWDAGPCELIGWTFSSDTFLFETDACRKILNEYTVINWCVNDWFNDPDGIRTKQFPFLWQEYENAANGSTGSCNAQYELAADNEDYIFNPSVDGVYTFLQTIKIVDTIPPVLASENDWFFGVINNDCDVDITISNSAFDPSDCEPTVYNWELFLDYNHDGIFDESFRQKARDVFFTLSTPLSGPMDSISARWKVWDGCGNTDRADFKIYAIDEKPPLPYCIDLSSALMIDPDGDGPIGSVIEIWAADFDRGSSDACFGEDIYFTFDNIPFIVEYLDSEHFYTASGLLYAIVLEGNESEFIYVDSTGDEIDKNSAYVKEVNDSYFRGELYNGERVYRWLPRSLSSNSTRKYTAGTVYNQNLVGAGASSEIEVVMTVWDGKLNSDFCTVGLTLRCDDCIGDVATVSGTIATEYNYMLEGVKVALNGLTNPHYNASKTTIGGQYAFNSIPMYESYDLHAKLDGDDDTGISTLDLLMIQRHILGLTPFTSPYKVIAADVNNDKRVTGSDIIILRKLVLGIYSEFPETDSWKFVDANQTLDIENVLEDYNEVINIISLDADRKEENYIGVKMGDVNEDVFRLRRDEMSTRSRKSIDFTVRNKNIENGDIVEVPIQFDGENELYGFQTAIKLNGMKLLGINAGLAEISDQHFFNQNDIVRISYSAVQPIENQGNLMTLILENIDNNEVANGLNFNSENLFSEGYTSGLIARPLQWKYEGQEMTFELNQNEPNPFSQFTIIEFSLPAENSAVLSIYDVSGKQLKLISGTYPAGLNKIKLDKNDLPSNGVLYYTLKSGSFTKTMKMIVLD